MQELLRSRQRNGRVTWLLPVKNGMPYLTEALESIATQTYRDWEVLARDDGSTDGTLEELRKWIPSRIPGRIVSGAACGIGASLAHLTELAETEFCARCDADDVNLPHRLEQQLNLMHESPEVAVVGSQMRLISPAGEDMGEYVPVPIQHADILLAMLYRTPIAHPTVLFRRSVVMGVGNYRSVVFEDYDLWVRIAVRHQLQNLPDPLVRYRIHPSGGYFARKLSEGVRVSEELSSDCLRSLFGEAGGQVGMLRERRHPFAIYPMLRMARHLSRSQSIPLARLIGSKSFRMALAVFHSKKDYVSKIWSKAQGILELARSPA